MARGLARLAQHFAQHQFYRLADGKQTLTVPTWEQLDEVVFDGRQRGGVSAVVLVPRSDKNPSKIAPDSNLVAIGAATMHTAPPGDCLPAHIAAIY